MEIYDYVLVQYGDEFHVHRERPGSGDEPQCLATFKIFADDELALRRALLSTMNHTVLEYERTH